MTLKEMLQTQGCITSVDITIRDENSKKLHQIRFGKYARADKEEFWQNGKPRWDTKNVVINHRDNGKDYFKYIDDSIPKQFEEMIVTHWRLSREICAYRHIINDCYELSVDLLKDGGTRQIIVEDTKQNEQLEGQITLFD